MSLLRKLGTLFFGLFLYAVGILLTIHADLGVAPWDVFHLGIVHHTELTLGQVSQLVGLVIIVICIFLKEIPGWGSVANMYFIGYFIDLLEAQQVLGSPNTLGLRLLMLFSGVFLMGWATYFYLNAGLGSGPRDGLMLGLSRLFKVKVAVPRTVIELAVLTGGFYLGGPVGVGTILIAFLVGPAIQVVYAIMGQDPRNGVHRTLVDDYLLVRRNR